jgi:uroporphyrinogen decarboxylase
MPFEPDYTQMLAVMRNERPARLPVYEHIISPVIMEKILGVPFAALEASEGSDLDEFFVHYTRFFKEMTYDTVSYEVCVTETLPGHGAIRGGKGPIQNPQDFEHYPWDDLPALYWAYADKKFAALAQHLPSGMKALGGVGNGVFEISEDLVGFECLAYLKADYPEVYVQLYQKIGDLMVTLWQEFLRRYAGTYAICRFGDDLGFKSGTLVSPAIIRQHVIPQYRRVIDIIHQAGKPFLWHSCGKIFAVMDDVLALGIQAKHSNEDVIAPYEKWIELYGSRIGLLGGIDVDLLCRGEPADIAAQVQARGQHYRHLARGYALGSGNSIPDYVPVEGYLAMLQGAQAIRQMELGGSA